MYFVYHLFQNFKQRITFYVIILNYFHLLMQVGKLVVLIGGVLLKRQNKVAFDHPCANLQTKEYISVSLCIMLFQIHWKSNRYKRKTRLYKSKLRLSFPINFVRMPLFHIFRSFKEPCNILLYLYVFPFRSSFI